MKESSELSLNIDGPGRLTAGLGRLPPARAPPRPRRDSQLAKIRLAFPEKPPHAQQGGQSPRRQQGKEDSCLLPARGGTHAARQSPGKARAAPRAEKCGGLPGHLEKGREVGASSLHQPTQPAAAEHLAPSFPENMNLHEPNQSENIPWVTPELAGSRWSHIPLILACRQARKRLTTDPAPTLPQPTPKPLLMASLKDTSWRPHTQKSLGTVPQLRPLGWTLTSARAAWGGSYSPGSSR